MSFADFVRTVLCCPLRKIRTAVTWLMDKAGCILALVFVVFIVAAHHTKHNIYEENDD